MAAISAAQIATRRRQRLKTLIDRCTINEVSRKSARGDQEWTTAASNVPCAVTTPVTTSPRSAGTIIAVSSEERSPVVAFAYDIDMALVKGGNRILVNGTTYEVLQSEPPGTGGHQVTAYCVERR